MASCTLLQNTCEHGFTIAYGSAEQKDFCTETSGRSTRLEMGFSPQRAPQA